MKDSTAEFFGKALAICFAMAVVYGPIALLIYRCGGGSETACERKIDDPKVSIFESGEFFTDKHFFTIQRINNPRNWDENEYFTGYGFSNKREEVMKSPDSCALKQSFFDFFPNGHLSCDAHGEHAYGKVAGVRDTIIVIVTQ